MVLVVVLLAAAWYQLSQQSQDESWVKCSVLSRVFVRREIWGRCRVAHALQEPVQVLLSAHACTLSLTGCMKLTAVCLLLKVTIMLTMALLFSFQALLRLHAKTLGDRMDWPITAKQTRKSHKVLHSH